MTQNIRSLFLYREVSNVLVTDGEEASFLLYYDSKTVSFTLSYNL